MLKNWDNNTWISSKSYIETFNNFLFKQIKLNENSKILEIGCARGKILGDLKSKLRLRFKPIGLDPVNHKDKDKRISFQKTDALSFFKKNKQTFDLILIKQTIHFLKMNDIKKLLILCNKSLNKNGVIFISNLDTYKNELPTFSLMDKKLKSSFKRHQEIFFLISQTFLTVNIRKFEFNVKISKKKYLDMVKQRYISMLLNFSNKQISNGMNEIDHKYGDELKFKDKLICFILKK
tara:strand:- start:1468 stop:2172 length:705 start_codon:yes stop_codon:yes gene_type:complete